MRTTTTRLPTGRLPGLARQGFINSVDERIVNAHTVKREKGKIDVLFASAGRGEAAKLGEITEQHFDAAFGLIARGTLFWFRRRCRCSTMADRSS
jgi:NAD(P)-dependent dehydrogenase (short-subunit alcohol dehydrogenase family)